MKKKMYLSAAAASVLTIMAACGDNGNDLNAGEENQPEENAGAEETADEEAAGDPAGDPAEDPHGEMPEPDTEDIPDIVAEVNGEEITKEEFEGVYQDAFMQQMQQAQMTGEEADEEQLQQDVAESMVGTELLLQEAEERDYEASDEEIEEMLDEIAAQSGMESGDELLAALEEQGMDTEDAMEEIETQIKMEKVIEDEAGEAEISDEELEEMYDQLVAQQEEMAGDGGEEMEIPSFEEIKPELEAQAQSEQQAEQTEAVVDELREDADVTVHL